MKKLVLISCLFLAGCSTAVHRYFINGNWVIEKLEIEGRDRESSLMVNMISFETDGKFSSSDSSIDTTTGGVFYFSLPDSTLVISRCNKLFVDTYHVTILKYDSLGYVFGVQLKSRTKNIMIYKLAPRYL